MLALLKNVSKGSSSLELVNRKRYSNERRFWTKKFIGGSQNRKCGFQSRACSKTQIRRIEASRKKPALYRFLSTSLPVDRRRRSATVSRWDDRKMEKYVEEMRESVFSFHFERLSRRESLYRMVGARVRQFFRRGLTRPLY